MKEINPHFEYSVGTPDRVREVKISTKRALEPETVLGLESVLILKDNGEPFKVQKFICSKCGLSTNYKDSDTTCEKCKKLLDKSNFKKRAKDIEEADVKGIIDNQVAYKCPTCGKVYDKPTLCCNKEFVSNSDSTEGFMCPDCQTVYTHPIKCCSGRMVRGDFYQNPSLELMMKMRNAPLVPIEMGVL